ncbi:hypothetical protein M885DRAFT_612398 [Pelagophyceae sp. CCMP2097]|nr:hypothetical protein M885DRAFT_612398 [Pelagophyceae sp. CCMP2097]|mmetsp:Transcript_21598/g.73212  ORF Transcript_21598/g.73212 Transcript_21598/m.73212 type:complete len:417 (+) Transcript_21598:117-1367(+)
MHDRALGNERAPGISKAQTWLFPEDAAKPDSTTKPPPPPSPAGPGANAPEGPAGLEGFEGGPLAGGLETGLDGGLEGLEGAVVWGAKAFCADHRRRLRSMRPETALKHYNVLLLGPAGVGKSSLVHTAWRAISGSPLSDAGLVDRLRLGWSTNEVAAPPAGGAAKSGGLRARHGTTALQSYCLQTPGKDSKAPYTAIYLQDTKGQQFFDEAESAFAQKVVDGHLRGGSTQERESLYYWAVVAKAGLGRLVKHSELAAAPHALVVVFDATLRSFKRMVSDAGAPSPQRDCYRTVIGHARAAGLGVFCVLTHVDVLADNADGADGDATASAGESEVRVGEKIRGRVDALRNALSAALGADAVPPERIFAIENYRCHKNSPDDALELAALELLAAVVDSSEAYLQQHAPKVAAKKCALS